MDFNDGVLESNLRTYYLNFYPYELLVKWLNYSENPTSLSNREFAFILKDDFHMRFLSFNDQDEFKEKLLKFIPFKIDIGAIYNRPPRDRKKVGDFYPVERELVFDIDLTDYDPIRNWMQMFVQNAGVGSRLLLKCWNIYHFGFKNLLWVFSGRRGIHCWVADPKARKLNTQAREAIAKYLVFDKKSQVINKHRVHPMAEHAYQVIMDSKQFDELVLEQGWLDSRERWSAVLKLCADPEMVEIMDKEFEGLTDAQQRWDLLKYRFDESARQRISEPPNPPTELAKNFLRLFLLEYAYPKLDEKVTTGFNHLLKAPFTIHPKTGQVAIPLDPKTVADFSLNDLPRVDKLAMEYENTNKDEQKENNEHKAYQQSSLAKHIEIFEAFIAGLKA